MLLQNQRRQQAMQLQQQQLQRQRMQLAGRQGSSLTMPQRLRLGQQTGTSGLRISSVSTLQNSSQRQLTPNVSLPSSISISRVEPEDIRQRLPAGTSMITSSSSQSQSTSRGGIRPMPKLKRGIRGGIGTPNQNSARSAWQQQIMANPMRQQQLRALQQQHGVANANGMMRNAIPGLKRAAMGSAGMPNVRKRMRGGSAGGISALGKPARLCRVCCQSNVANFKLSERPDIIRALDFIIGLKIGAFYLFSNMAKLQIITRILHELIPLINR